MSREKQSQSNAPNRGTLIRQSSRGASTYTVQAIEMFPAPASLSPLQASIWTSALGDVPLEFFRARHIPMMIQYVQAVELMMRAQKSAMEDPDDPGCIRRWKEMMQIVSRLENHLALNTSALISLVVRSRTELKLAQRDKKDKENSAGETADRAGLTYVAN